MEYKNIAIEEKIMAEEKEKKAFNVEKNLQKKKKETQTQLIQSEREHLRQLKQTNNKITNYKFKENEPK